MYRYEAVDCFGSQLSSACSPCLNQKLATVGLF
jgi:hypothetical protein